MENRNGNLRTLILMITAALFVVLGISLVAFFSSRDAGRTGITLPPEGWQSSEQTHLPGEGFITVTTDNVSLVIENLKRPAYYHQTLSQTTTAGETSGRLTTDIWVYNGVWKIITTSDGQTRHILTDGKTAYLWYRDETWRVDAVTLPEGVSPDDLAGVLTYESITDIPADAIRTAEYLQLEEQNGAPCLFVESQQESGVVDRYWVDLATGLLCLADCSMEDREIYRLEQTSLSVLESSDEGLGRQMLLPDGSDPFATASAETPQE